MVLTQKIVEKFIHLVITNVKRHLYYKNFDPTFRNDKIQIQFFDVFDVLKLISRKIWEKQNSSQFETFSVILD